MNRKVLSLLLPVVFGLLFVATPSALLQRTPTQAAAIAKTKSKKCTWNDVGSEGCDVTLNMKISPKSPCYAGCDEYRVSLVVKCPAGIPAGDPAEECTSAENCEICCDTGSGTTVTVDCDGQTFTVGPKNMKNWGDGFKDCGNLKASA